MPYSSHEDLPENVRKVLPEHAQDIWLKAYNNAYDQYADPDKRRGDADQDEVSAKVAWSAVKQKYEKGSDGRWHEKS